jgi:hypothetical protein
MAGAKQLRTLDLSWFRPGPYVQQWCARALYCLHHGARRGVATSKAGEKVWPPSPKGLIEASANIVEKAESVRVITVRRPVSPRLGHCPSFYRPRGEHFTCMPHCFPTCGGMASSAVELTAVLANAAPVEASCVLCPYRSGFEGGGIAVG